MCRRSDQVQAWIGSALVLAALAATPPAVFLAGGAAHDHYTRTAQSRAAGGRHTSALLLEDARRHPEPGSAEAGHVRYPAGVRFTDPQGRTRTATAEVPPGLSRGSTVRVWTTADGRITDEPLDPDEIRSRALGWAIIAALAVPLTAAAAYGIAHRVIRRRNLAAWDRAWAETAPRWTPSS
ncbi:Rv1733c family protein [Streptomyces indicus]|uniref:Proline rich protein membrane protein n=1 Tax=Streptomyces indicus TaxID=417292 RepID=A0A1G9DEQ4_9ACTN|nr:hypothetical protein [Streptomyces indicus]SDK62333.1 hypothetical protein SAMN05421806_109184 [Streptomyces indicus]